MPRIIGNSLADHRKRTRAQLFEALSTLMQTETFESLTMSQIAQAAGVGRTAVYNHFKDKEDILLAYLTYETRRYAAQLQKALEGTQNPLTQLNIYIREQLLLTERYCLAPGSNLRTEISQDNAHELHTHAEVLEVLLKQILRRAIRTGLFPPQNLSLLVSLVNTTLAGRTLPRDPAKREYMIRVIQCFVLRGLGAEHQVCPLPQSSDFFDSPPGLEFDLFAEDETAASRLIGCPVHKA